MGLYPIKCPTCPNTHLWFSGNPDQRCADCIKLADKQEDEYLDQMDRKLNQTPLTCGHKPCTLGHCKGCDQHCGKGRPVQCFQL